MNDAFGCPVRPLHYDHQYGDMIRVQSGAAIMRRRGGVEYSFGQWARLRIFAAERMLHTTLAV